MFETVIYNSLFNYFQSNRLFTPSQSGFLPGDSYGVEGELLSLLKFYFKNREQRVVLNG